MKNGSIYLSGGMQYAKKLGAGWRETCSKRLIKMGFRPLDISALDISYAKDHGELYTIVDNDDVLQRKSDIRKHFVHSDLRLIENYSDAMITYYNDSARRGAGTISECQHAYNLDIPNFVVSAYHDWRKQVPGWLHAISTKLFTSFSELYEYLEGLPEGILKRDRYGNRHAETQYLCSLCGSPFKKTKQQFVSKVSPLYCKECVEVTAKTNETKYDRYQFFVEMLGEK